jgi:hypothetical protein
VLVGDERTVKLRVADQVSALQTLEMLESTHKLDYVSAIQVLWSFQAPELVWMLFDHGFEFFVDIAKKYNSVYVEILNDF